MKLKNEVKDFFNKLRTWALKEIAPDNIFIKKNAINFFVGLVAFIVFTGLYSFCYIDIELYEISKNIDQILLMGIFTILAFVGFLIMLSVFNLDNYFVQIILMLILVIVRYKSLTVKPLQLAFTLLIISLFVFFVIKILSKIFITIITFSISSLISLLIFYFLVKIIPQVDFFSCLYICLSVMLVLYNIIGVKINQFVLKVIFGYSPEELQKYDYNQLKNQLNLIYLFMFVYLNASGSLFSDITEVSLVTNYINNALITGVCITNVNWKSLSMKNG